MSKFEGKQVRKMALQGCSFGPSSGSSWDGESRSWSERHIERMHVRGRGRADAHRRGEWREWRRAPCDITPASSARRVIEPQLLYPWRGWEAARTGHYQGSAQQEEYHQWKICNSNEHYFGRRDAAAKQEREAAGLRAATRRATGLARRERDNSRAPVQGHWVTKKALQHWEFHRISATRRRTAHQFGSGWRTSIHTEGEKLDYSH
jgi:hypothetical protein